MICADICGCVIGALCTPLHLFTNLISCYFSVKFTEYGVLLRQRALRQRRRQNAAEAAAEEAEEDAAEAAEAAAEAAEEQAEVAAGTGDSVLPVREEPSHPSHAASESTTTAEADEPLESTAFINK